MDEPWATYVELAAHGDWTATRRLEDEIERRQLQHAYLAALIEAVEPDVSWADFSDELMPMWRLLRATPEQRAAAFREATT